MIDDIDRSIITVLQEDARTSNAEIARRVGMAPSAILERIRKLEERGVIKGYSVKLDPALLGHGLLAFILVRTEGGGWGKEIGEKLSEIPEIQEIHHIAGEDCFLIKARVRDTSALGTLVRDQLSIITSLRSTRTTIVLHTAKETTAIPLNTVALET